MSKTKSVISKQTHYSVIFMRDDADVMSFRMKSTTLKFLIIFFMVVIIFGGLGITGSILVGKRYMALSDSHRIMEAELVEKRLQLDRLSSLQTLLNASNDNSMPASRAKNEEIGVAAAQPGQQNATVAATAIPADASGAGSQANATVVAENQPGANMGQSSQNATAARLIAQPPGQDMPLISSDDSPVRVTNMTIRVSGTKRLRVRYDLATLQELRQQLSGRVTYALILEDGSRVNASIIERDEARFAILRMKNMDNSLQMSVDTEATARMVKAVEVTVNISDGASYREVFALEPLEETVVQ